MYIVYETSPPSLRGPLGGLTQIQIFTGVIIVFTLGLGVPERETIMIGSGYWRLIMFFPILIAAS